MAKDTHATVKSVSNLQVHPDFVIVQVNTKIYPLDTIYYAAYVFLDRAFVVLDGNPSDLVSVELRPKDKTKDPEELGRNFNDELLSYSLYKIQAERGKDIRESILRQVLRSVEETAPEVVVTEDDGYPLAPESRRCETTENAGNDDPLGIAKAWEETTANDILQGVHGQSYADDPLGIAKPWEEVYGKIEAEPEKDPSYIEDPLGIMKPWEEVYGKNKKQEQ
jgi:His-Xaa-Ser system protein HxsD